MVLPDVMGPGLRVVFCGTAASRVSAQVGAYYAGPGNRFWPTLYEIGLISQPLQPTQFRDVLQWGIGLTDLAKQAFGMDHQIASDAYDRAGLIARIRRWQPGCLAFTSKKAASICTDLPTQKIAYGWQPEEIGATRLYVLPSPSGAARRAWNIAHWRRLADELNGA